MKFAWYHYTFLSELYYIKLANDFFIPIESGVWSVIRDDGTDVDAVNVVHVLITQEAADQEQTDPDIHDQELLRPPPEENIVWALIVCVFENVWGTTEQVSPGSALIRFGGRRIWCPVTISTRTLGSENGEHQPLHHIHYNNISISILKYIILFSIRW